MREYFFMFGVCVIDVFVVVLVVIFLFVDSNDLVNREIEIVFVWWGVFVDGFDVEWCCYGEVGEVVGGWGESWEGCVWMIVRGE